MEEFKGTKAAWQQSHRVVDDEGNYSTQVYDEKGETICTVDWYPVRNGNVTSTHREDNAKLIAAAPELLEALQGLTFRMEQMLERGKITVNKQNTETDVRIAIIAIEKALGKNF